MTTSLLEDKEVVLFLAPYSFAVAAPAVARARSAGIPSLVVVGSSGAMREQQGGEVFFLQTPARKHLADAVVLLLSSAVGLAKESLDLKVVLVAAGDDHSQAVINGARARLEAAGIADIVDHAPSLPAGSLLSKSSNEPMLRQFSWPLFRLAPSASLRHLPNWRRARPWWR